MQENIIHPHNNLFQKVMTVVALAEQMLSHLLPELYQHLEVGSLELTNRSFVDEQLKEHISDIIYKARWQDKDVLVELLFEHKSKAESPHLQLGRYLFNGYQQQKTDYFKQRTVDKTAKSRTGFRHKAIIPILFYHGNEKWQKQPFYEDFDLPDESLRRFIPFFDYYLININAFSDLEIERLSSGLLKAMLLLFKHKGNAEYVQHNSQKIYKFVYEENEISERDVFIKTVTTYIYNAFKMSKQQIVDIIDQIPPEVKGNFESTADVLRAAGFAVGIEEGRAKGLAEGRSEGKEEGRGEGIEKGKVIQKIKGDLEKSTNLIKKLPTFSDAEIADLLELKEDYIKEIRRVFSHSRNTALKKFLKEQFKAVPYQKNEESKDFEKWGLALRKKFKRKTKKKIKPAK